MTAATKGHQRVINPRPLQEPRRPFIINKGRSVDAIYVTPELSEWADNLLISGLPPALDVAQAAARLAQEPKYDERLRTAPNHIRRLLLQNTMKFLFIPLDIHLDLHQRLQCAIRVGYADRDPLAADYVIRLEKRLDKFDQYAAGQRETMIDGSATTASGFHILGLSGGGKSRTILRCLHLLPQTIRHSRFRDRNFTCKQLVWLKLDCPFDGNPKGLCIQFFNTTDAILGTDYRRNYAGKQHITDEMLSNMALVAANHSLGMLVVDEIQRLSLAKSGGADKMLNFFVQLVSTIGVPVVLVGTYKGMSVLSGEFSQIRRGTGQGDMIWDRMENDAQWCHFIESLWHYQYVRKDSSPDDRGKDGLTLSDVLYDETQGIIDFAVKLFMFAQERAIETGRERIDAGVIRKAAKDKLKIPRKVLHALRTKDMRILEQFEDIYPSAMKDYLSGQGIEPQLSGKLESSPEINALIEEYRQGKINQAQVADERPNGMDAPVMPDDNVGRAKAN
jgi:AAA domain-containing protein